MRITTIVIVECGDDALYEISFRGLQLEYAIQYMKVLWCFSNDFFLHVFLMAKFFHYSFQQVRTWMLADESFIKRKQKCL